MEVKRFELQSSDNGKAGDRGFKITGESKKTPGRLARVWLRRRSGGGRHVWTRYLDPVARSNDWEVRVHVIKGTGAMTNIDFSPARLDELAEDYAFPTGPESVEALKDISIDDPLFSLMREWVFKVTA